MQERDFIKITGLKIFAHHGVLLEEKEKGQDFFINAKLYYSMRTPGMTDELDSALNYADCCAYMTEMFTEKSFDLIEAAAQNLCEKMLLHYELLENIELELCKPHAPIGLPFSNVSVNMARGWHKVYLSFGSNMGERETLIRQGILCLEKESSIRKIRVSGLIETEPYGPVEQENFLNGCLALETYLNPEELLVLLHEIEAKAKRKREIHWGPRTLDLDILFYDKEVYESDDLIIPHMDLQNRLFVLEPLRELCPNFRHPVLGLTVEQMYQHCVGQAEKWS